MATKKKAVEDPCEGTKILVLTQNDGKERRIIVPKYAKVTFCPGIPGGRKTYGDNEYAIRVYGRTKEDLLAVIAGVREFRESTIDSQTLVTREAGTTVWKSDENGYKQETNVSYERIVVDDHQKLLKE